MNITGDYIGFDLETKDPNLLTHGPGWAFDNTEGHPVGYAVSWFEGNPEELTLDDLTSGAVDHLFKKEYLPVRHGAGGNLEMSHVKGIIQPLLLDPSKTMVMANCLYDYGWTLWDGFEWKAKIEDVQIQAPLLDDQRRSYSLDNLGKDYLGERKNEEALKKAAKEWGLKNVKGEMWKLPAAMVAPYAKDDARLTLKLFFYLRILMREKELDRVHQLEKDLVPVLYAMRKKGVAVDEAGAQKLRGVFKSKEQEAVDALKQLTQVHIDPWASATVIKALEEEGVTDFPLTPKKQEKSVDNVFLKQLQAHDNTAGKIATEVLKLRRYNKARSTFVENMVLEHAVNGRIHCELKALRSDDGGTVSGRFSCASPNLQQVPARDPELAPLIRGLFLPDNGLWTAVDYSSQEPRIAVHFAVKAGMPGAAEAAQRFKDDPRTDPYIFTAEACGVTRKQAKAIRLGILYGMGGGKLCSELGLPTEVGEWKGREVLYAGPEGKALLEKFDQVSPMDKALSALAQRTAKSRGYVRTVYGRRSNFPRQRNGEVWFTHKALNRIIQGSAADMTKQAMINCHNEGYTPLVSVHDELGFDLPDEKTGRLVAEIMGTAIPLEVPIVCDVEQGRTWGDSMDFD